MAVQDVYTVGFHLWQDARALSVLLVRISSSVRHIIPTLISATQIVV